MNDIEREKVREEAKQILDRFMKSLGKVDVRNRNAKIEKSQGFREEQEGLDGEQEFRELMFENAPKKEGDCILAEKKKW